MIYKNYLISNHVLSQNPDCNKYMHRSQIKKGETFQMH